MNCEDFELYGSAYIDNMLSSKEKLEFESHINECDCCNNKFQNLKIIIESANEIEEVELPINFSNELKAKLEKEKGNQTKNMIFNNKKMLSLIVAGVFIIITSVSLLNNSSTYKNRNNLLSKTDQMSENQEKVAFDISLEESKELSDGVEKESAKQPRIMAIDNVDESQESAVGDSIKETNEENTSKIMTAKKDEDFFENKDSQSQPTENSYNRTMNLFGVLLLIGGVGVLIYKISKK